jgi:hypothetical protein
MSQSTPPAYFSGERIQAGDHVRYLGEHGRVEFVTSADDPDMRWYIGQCGDGCMVLAPSFGRVFVAVGDKDLQFVLRGEA